MKERSVTAYKLQLLFGIFVFASIGIFRAFINIDSVVLACLRAFLGAAALYIELIIRGRKIDWACLKSHAKPLFIISTIMAANWVLIFEAYTYISVSVATVLYYSQPIYMIILSLLIFKEKLTPAKIVCVIVSFIGIIMVSGLITNGIEGAEGILLLKGVIFAILAAIGCAVCIMWSKSMTDVPVYDRTIAQLVIAGIELIPFSLVPSRLATLSGLDSFFSVMMLLILGVFCTGTVYGIYYTAIEKVSAQTVSMYSYLNPVLALLMSVIILHERMDVWGIIGSILVVGSTFLCTMRDNAVSSKPKAE